MALWMLGCGSGADEVRMWGCDDGWLHLYFWTWLWGRARLAHQSGSDPEEARDVALLEEAVPEAEERTQGQRGAHEACEQPLGRHERWRHHEVLEMVDEDWVLDT